MTPIIATGARGFLLWLKQQQPGIYARVAPTLPKLVPEIFSKSLGRLQRLRTIYRTGVARRSPQRLGDYYSSYSAPVTVDYSSTLTGSQDYAAGVVDYSAQLNAPVCAVSSVCPGPAPTLSSNDAISSAATAGNISGASASAIGSAVNAVAGTVLTASQAATLANIIAQQLANAQAGTTPKPISTSSLGLPTVQPKTSGTTELLLLAAAGFAAWMVLS